MPVGSRAIPITHSHLRGRRRIWKSLSFDASRCQGCMSWRSCTLIVQRPRIFPWSLPGMYTVLWVLPYDYGTQEGTFSKHVGGLESPCHSCQPKGPQQYVCMFCWHGTERACVLVWRGSCGRQSGGRFLVKLRDSMEINGFQPFTEPAENFSWANLPFEWTLC